MSKYPHIVASVNRLTAKYLDRDLTAKQASAVIVGDIFVSSWGYDQTNVDFYQIVKVMKSMVAMRPISKKVVGPKGDGQSAHKVMPEANKFTGGPIRKKLKSGWQGDAWINLNSYSGASKWNGKPQTQTGYA
jgi:hypothetical protein